jgi:TM2 domain-containing membrane protein YozV
VRNLVRALCWIGLLLATALIGAAVWFHLHLDAIIRIPFVLGSAWLGLMIGFYCLFGLLRSRRDDI